MGTHMTMTAKFSHIQACKNQDYAQLLFYCKSSSMGLTGIPNKPNVRITVPSDSSHLQSFQGEKNYHINVDVSVSQPTQKDPRASLNYEILDFKAA